MGEELYRNRSANCRKIIRQAALTACLRPHALECNALGSLPDREWRVLLSWLHLSGLSLYLLDKLKNAERTDLLPPSVRTALQENLTDNIARTRSMIAELAEISASFERVHLSFAVLKGLSLHPLSVPRPWLRSQADLDFLIAERDVTAARKILEDRRFHLHAVSGRNWEFRTGPIHTASLQNIYRAIPFRCVELHLESSCTSHDSVLSRAKPFSYEDLTLPGLASLDLFIGQGLHLYKHVCSEFFRVAHVLEFHNHMVARAHDLEFWQQLRTLISRHPVASLKLGVVTLLTAKLCADTAAENLAWTVDGLPAPVRLWVERYGESAAFADTPGSKLYLLLEAAMASAGVPARRSVLRALLPRNVPRVGKAPRDETWSYRVRRYRVQARFLRERCRFHIVEGFRYLRESIVWSRELARDDAKSSPLDLLQAKQRSDNSLTDA